MRPIFGSALLLGVLASTACQTMKTVPLDQLVALKPNRVWVTEADQSVVLVTGPINVIGDTLVGYVAGAYAEMPADSLKQFVVRQPATTRTAVLVTSIAAGIGAFVFAVAGSTSGNMAPPPISGDCDKHPELCMN